MTTSVLSAPLAARLCAGIVRRVHANEDDAALMTRYSRGDVAAFTRLYERHKGALYRYLLRLTRDRAVTEDLFQEVWSRIVASRRPWQRPRRASRRRLRNGRQDQALGGAHGSLRGILPESTTCSPQRWTGVTNC